MTSIEKRLAELDLGLFEAIFTQTVPDDRRALMAVQRCIRLSEGGYSYLEIGS